MYLSLGVEICFVTDDDVNSAERIDVKSRFLKPIRRVIERVLRAREQDSKTARQQKSRRVGGPASKRARQQKSKRVGEPASKTAGEQDSQRVREQETEGTRE